MHFIAPEAINSSAEWQARISGWGEDVHGPPPPAEFLDLRSVLGDGVRVERLRDAIMERVGAGRDFLFLVAVSLVENRPPIGFFKQFVVARDGGRRQQLDLYEKGVRPLAESIRLMAVARRCPEVGTLRRLVRLSEGNSPLPRADDVAQALEYLWSLLLHHQLRQEEEGVEPDTLINLDGLSVLERKTLKETFLLTATLYDKIEKLYISDILL